MSSYFKIKDGIGAVNTIRVAKQLNGITRYMHIRPEPGIAYEISKEESRDSGYINSLMNAEIEKHYSVELAEELKAVGIEPVERRCKSCGGKVKKLAYKVLEVVIDGT